MVVAPWKGKKMLLNTFVFRRTAVLVSLAILLASCHKGGLPVEKRDATLKKSADLLIGTLSRNTATVVRLYPGPDGLVGVIFRTKEGAMRVVWMTPHGAAIVPGPVITAAGQNLTGIAQTAVDAVSKTLPKSASGGGSALENFSPSGNAVGSTPDSTQTARPSPFGKKMSASDFLTMSRHLKSIAIGRGRREIWVYFDPDCIFCNRLYESLKPYGNQVRAHWIPVGFLKKDDSLKKATGILQAKDPASALAENEDRFDTGSEEGGYPIPAHLDPTLERAVATSTIGLGQATGELATPTIVFEGKDGKPESLMGLPADLKAFLAGVKG